MRAFKLTVFQILVATSFSLAAVEVHAEVDQSLLKQFRSAVKNAKHLRSRAALHVRVSSVTNYSEATKKLIEAEFRSPEAMKQFVESREKASENQIEYAMLDGQLLEKGLGPDGNYYVSVANKDYLFHVTEIPLLDQYSMKWLTRAGESIDQIAAKALEKKKELVNAFVMPAFSIYGTSLEGLVESEDFRVTAISKVTKDEKELVRVEFERIEEEFRPGGTLTDGYLICNPSLEWAISEYATTWNDAEGKPSGRKEVLQEISEEIGAIPFVNKIKMTTTWFDNPDHVDTSMTTIELVSDKLSNDMFHLSGYGLSEPKFENSWLTNWSWLIYLIAGIGCLGAAYFWRRRQALTSQAA